MENRYYIIGIDGGASKTRGVLFSEKGETLASAVESGSNLAVYGELAGERIKSIIINLCQIANIPIDHIDAIGLGLAGASDEDGREMVFKVLDELKLSQRAIIANDAEAAYELNCPGDFGILVTVGTGVICISRNAEGNTIRTAGKGHDNGDIGSGFWMGKQGMLHLSLNETAIEGDGDLESMMEAFLSKYPEENFQDIVNNIYESSEAVAQIADFSEDILNLAECENELAVSIVQEASHAVAEYIIALTEEMNYTEKQIVLAGNGSVIRNEFFRKSVNDDLRFQFPEIKWTFSAISPAYGAGIMAAKIQNVDVKIGDVVKGNALAST
ncbi:MAG: BadF/BadG/BcrA/BcrD ATPase family protein [Candidatus Marinimicrobia bacterium]|jgi:N-acetylglucosamine kinase-like BadF-type ATPase|nr:BadF/BadG/BcrA/BcrD ATPase family protein [Candidatus Neomarinimicrobiota bacterium]MDP6935956.1 BadF/BadG/BcrA/BcrD ATPase family protein [Candidatus Neomarinimicrobiota bacterium]